jgi:hypothetical protein
MNYRPYTYNVLAAIGALFACTAAKASLIGDTLTIAHHDPDLGAVLTTQDVTVQAGTADQFNVEGQYIVNPEASAILVSFTQSGTWASQNFNGLVVSGITGPIGGYSVSTNLVGWNNNQFSSGGGSLSANWSGLPYNPSSYFNVTVEPANGVPDTGASFGLFAAGMLALSVAARRFRR